jgi:hypothetical protein
VTKGTGTQGTEGTGTDVAEGTDSDLTQSNEVTEASREKDIFLNKNFFPVLTEISRHAHAGLTCPRASNAIVASVLLRTLMCLFSLEPACDFSTRFPARR